MVVGIALVGAPGVGAAGGLTEVGAGPPSTSQPEFADGEWAGDLVGNLGITAGGGSGSGAGAGRFMLTVEGGTIVAGVLDVRADSSFSAAGASAEGTITASGTISGAADAPIVEASGRFVGTVTARGITTPIDQAVEGTPLFLTIVSATCSVVIGTLEPDVRDVLAGSGVGVTSLSSRWVATRTRASGRERAEDFGTRVVALIVEGDRIIADWADGTIDTDPFLDLLRRAERLAASIPRAVRCSTADADDHLATVAVVVHNLLELIVAHPHLFDATVLSVALEATVRTGLVESDPDLIDALRAIVAGRIADAASEGDTLALGILGYAASTMGWEDEAQAAHDALAGSGSEE